MPSGGNDFKYFHDIVPAREITTKIEKNSFSRPWPWAYFSNVPNAAASAHVQDLSLIAHSASGSRGVDIVFGTPHIAEF